MTLLAMVIWWMQRRQRPSIQDEGRLAAAGERSPGRIGVSAHRLVGQFHGRGLGVVAVLAVIASVAAGVQVYRVGYS